jgi:hypothetical protein
MTSSMKITLTSVVKHMRPSKKTILLILIAAIVAIVISSTVSILLSRTTRLYVPSFGTIKTIGVEAYWDKALENKISPEEPVNWGTIWAGSSQNVTFYVRSISNIEATLRLTATNWNPANLSEYMTLSWNYNRTPVQPRQVIQVTLTLSASSSYALIHYLITNDIRQFSFDIIIAASEES